MDNTRYTPQFSNYLLHNGKESHQHANSMGQDMFQKGTPFTKPDFLGCYELVILSLLKIERERESLLSPISCYWTVQSNGFSTEIGPTTRATLYASLRHSL